MKKIHSFELAKYRLLLRAQGEILLPPYKGSAFRGGFGHALKQVVCVNRGAECDRCMLRDKCVYSYLFESPALSGVKIASVNTYAPHPFVIEPPLDDKGNYRLGETLELHLILIGRAIEYLPYFLVAFDELGRLGIGRGKGRYRLERVWSVGPWGERLIFIGEEQLLLDPGKPVTFESLTTIVKEEITRAEIEFLTPTRLKEEGRLVSQIPFPVLLQALLRRISALLHLYCGASVDDGVFELMEESHKVVIERSDLRWWDWERYSQRQELRMKLGGVVGKIVYVGPLELFMPYLFLGEYIHVGKGTSFGLGQIHVRLPTMSVV